MEAPSLETTVFARDRRQKEIDHEGAIRIRRVFPFRPHHARLDPHTNATSAKLEDRVSAFQVDSDAR